MSALHKLGLGVLSSSRAALARAITLAESTLPAHREQAEQMLEFLAKEKEKEKSGTKSTPSSSNRWGQGHFTIGVAGPPGAGKSTFIEALGLRLVDANHRVAVIPVDPSSPISRGSILGDKTRMERLSRSDNAYIRAAPTRGVLGGVAEKTNEVIFLCALAGFDVCIVESVGDKPSLSLSYFPSLLSPYLSAIHRIRRVRSV